tara:strand:- start:11 stop:490 length:480 start_codon:yes stop_codon:yes gene_type:complete
MKLSQNFSLSELSKSSVATRKGIDNNPNEAQIDNLKNLCDNVLQKVRDQFGAVTITSGFRSAQLCLEIGSSVNSQHTASDNSAAADFECIGTSNALVADWIFQNCEFDQLILEFFTPGEPNSGWVHCSYSSKKNRKQYLRAYKENGKTLYKPVLGKMEE